MSQLTPKERALFDMARKEWGPSASADRAMRAGIAERLRADPSRGMDAPGPSSAASGGSSVAALLRSPWGVMTGLAVVSLCVAFGAHGVGSEPTSQVANVLPPALVPPPALVSPSPASDSRVVPAPADEVETVAVAALPDVAQDVAPKKSQTAARTAPEGTARPERSARVDSIAEEVALVRAAQTALRNGAPSDALTSLSAHASRFPTGALRQERMTLQVLALCALGDMVEARRLRAELEQLAPASSLLQRLSCASP